LYWYGINRNLLVVLLAVVLCLLLGVSLWIGITAHEKVVDPMRWSRRQSMPKDTDFWICLLNRHIYF